MSFVGHLPEIGAGIVGRAVTATLYVSPNGDNTNGKTWATAYQTINAALDAASTDGDVLTQILIGPHTTFYDINTTGDPTWTGNYELKGSHRLWAAVKNTHASATSVMKFTGKASLMDLAIFTQGSVDGVIFTKSGARVRNCGFNSENLAGAATSIYLDGSSSAIRGAILEDIQFLGNVTYTKALRLNAAYVNEIFHLHIHKALVGIHMEGAASDFNHFENCDIGECALGIDLDAGDDTHFDHIDFHHNTANIDDEVGNAIWKNIHGQFAIAIEPEDLDGVEITAGNDDWGADTEIRAALTSTIPFKVVAYQLSPSSDETTLIRLSADSGSTFFAESIFASKKNKAATSSAGTEFIFNKGTRISASVWSPAAGRTVDIWLEIQEI